MDLRSSKILAFGVIPVLVLLVGYGCSDKVDTPCGSTPVPESKSQPSDEPDSGTIRLRQAKTGSVLILEEPATPEKSADQGDDSLSGRPAEPLPAGYRAFRDQHIKLYVDDVAAALGQAVQAARAASGEVINHPIKGFENMGPNEKTLVFDSRTYPMFVKKLKLIGEVESPEIGPSDYVTVRLTVLKNSNTKN